jgi:hypothetical protein
MRLRGEGAVEVKTNRMMAADLLCSGAALRCALLFVVGPPTLLPHCIHQLCDDLGDWESAGGASVLAPSRR